jgi:hypothetical protein
MSPPARSSISPTARVLHGQPASDREDQRTDAVHREGDAGGIEGRPRPRDRKGLARDARERNIREVHPRPTQIFRLSVILPKGNARGRLGGRPRISLS